MVRLFLFNDSIVIAESTKRSNSGAYEAIDIGDNMKDVRIQHSLEEDNTFELILQRSGRVYTLQAATGQEKEEWMDDISMAISERMVSPSRESKFIQIEENSIE